MVCMRRKAVPMVGPMRAPVLGAIALAVLGCGPSRTTMARYPNAAPAFDRAKSDPKAVELADKVLAAVGGMTKWNGVKQLRWSEQVLDGEAVKIEGEEAWDRWNARHYGRIFGEHGDVVIKRELYSDKFEAFGEQSGHRAELPETDEDKVRKSAQERFQFDTVALCAGFLLEEPGSHLAYAGTTQGDAGDLEVITLTFDPNDKARETTSYNVAIDPKTNLIERLEVVKASGSIGYKISG